MLGPTLPGSLKPPSCQKMNPPLPEDEGRPKDSGSGSKFCPVRIRIMMPRGDQDGLVESELVLNH